MENNKEKDIIEEKLKKSEKELLDIKKNIEKLNNKMIYIKNILENLKIKKNEKKKEIKNLLSNKETLEEMYNMEIIFIKNNQISSFNNNEINNCNINISIEEIKQIKIDVFTCQIKELIKILFNKMSNDNLFNETKNVYDNFKNISEFIENISKIILKYNENNNNNKYSMNLITSLLHYLIKINSINKIIEDSKNFIKIEYKNKKQEINGELVEITFSLIFFENEKRKILNLNSKLKDKLSKLKKIIQSNDKIYINENNKIDIKNEEIKTNINNIKKENEFNSSIKNKTYKEIKVNIREKNNINLNNNIFNDNNIDNNIFNINNNNLNNNISNNNNYNGGNIEIRYDNNLNTNIFSEREETKNKIYENYVNNGIVLNDKRKKIIKRYKLNFNSISGNISKEQQKERNKDKEKILLEKKNYSTSFNYNFDSNFLDLKINKKNRNNNNMKISTNSDRKDLIKNNNISINNNNNNAQVNKTKHLNRNKNQRYYLSNINNICNDNKNNTHKNINLNLNTQLKLKIKQNRTHLRNSDSSFLTNYRKKNQRISNFQKYLDRFISNSSIDLNDNYKSMNNIKNNTNNNDIFKSFRTKGKNISNIIINDLDNNNYNYNLYNNKKSKTNRNTYLNTKKKNEKILSDNLNLNLDNKYDLLDMCKICKQKKMRRFSNLNLYERKKIIKLNNNSCYTINNNTNYNIKNRPNEFNNELKEYELDNQIKIFEQGDMETFCFYKIIKKNKNYNCNSNKYNALKDSSINPEYFGYNKCYISIDVINGCLKISPKIPFNKIRSQIKNNEYLSIINNSDNCFYFNIKLKEIYSIFIDKYMQNIIKIQNIISKFNEENNNIVNGFSNTTKMNKIFIINKIMNKKELKEIKLEKKEIIKAALCNYFSFSFSLGKNNNIFKTKIDLVFIDFEKFNSWFNTLNSIGKNNVKLNKINIISYKNIKSKIKTIADKNKKQKQNKINFKKIYNYNSLYEKIRAKSNIQSNKCFEDI